MTHSPFGLRDIYSKAMVPHAFQTHFPPLFPSSLTPFVPMNFQMGVGSFHQVLPHPHTKNRVF